MGICGWVPNLACDDGVRAVAWEPPAGQQLLSSDIRSLRAARDGRLWIGTFRGLASWKDGKLSHYVCREHTDIKGGVMLQER